MNMYINYYKNEINDEMDQDPIGIILCSDKEQEIVDMSIQGLQNNIFVAKYTTIIPNIEVLQNEVRKEIEAFNNKE